MAALLADQTNTDPRTPVRNAALACLAAGVLGAASGIFLAVFPTDGSDDTWRYPLSATGFAAIQVWFAVQHLGLLAGIVALFGVDGAHESRAARAGIQMAAAGMALLTVTEVLAIAARDADLDEYAYLNVLYGVATVLPGVGLILTGIAVGRSGRWRGWRAWVVLATGVWVFVPMTPAIASGFLAARLGITGWMLLFAALGWALWRTPPDREHR